MSQVTQRVFTDAYLRGLKAKAKPYKRAEYAPKGEGRLIIRVLPSGVKEAFYRYRVAGQDTTIAIGRYDHRGQNGQTLAELRIDLRKKRAIQGQTGDVKAHLKAEERRRQLEHRQGTLRQLLAAYVESLKAANKTSWREAEGVFERHVLKPFPALADANACGVEPGDIQRVLAKMVRAGIKRQVNVTRAYLRAAFQFGAQADHDPRTVAADGVLFGLKSNPVVTVPRIAEYELTRERALSDEELRHYWKKLEALPIVQRATLRFNLALCCQRVRQLLRADWTTFDLDAGTVLLKDAKGRGGSRDHLVPLTTFARQQLKPLVDLNMATECKSPFTSDGRRLLVLETLSNAVAGISKDLKEEHGFAPFQLRDLRRTAETALQRLGVEKEVRAQLLSHGRSKGIQGKHYERYDFLSEKRVALEKWTDYLKRVIDPKQKAKVVHLAKRRPRA